MRKILFVITKSNWGGAQRYVYDLATALPKADWRVAVVMGGTGEQGAPGGRLEEELRHKDVTALFIPAFMRDVSLRADWQAFRQLYDLFATERPDVVHLNSSKAGGLGALAAQLAGVPHIVFTSHGLVWDEDRNPLTRAAIWFASWLTFLLCDRVIVLSQDNYARARKLPFCKNKITLVYNGVAPLEFLARQEAREALQLPQDALVVGALGELTWNKQLHVLIRAFGELVRGGFNGTLCIIGGGEEQQFLETLLDELKLQDRVRLAGFVPNGHHYLKAFDVFVLPSVKEGLPYVLMEAGQAGLPVIATRISGSTDILDEAGVLVQPKKEKELAEALTRLLADAPKRAALAAALQARVQKEFSLEHMVSATLGVYAN
jgi:glycosyltransferase involved in cell wall biosynthesis